MHYLPRLYAKLFVTAISILNLFLLMMAVRMKRVKVLTQLANIHANIRIIVFSRNFGKEAALTAGLDHAVGDAVIVMDVDLQDPPELIIEFVAKWREGYEVVYGSREDRKADTFAKRVTAGGFYRLFNKISGIKIPENTGDYRLMDRRVVESIKALPERSRFMKGLFAWVGYKSIGVSFARHLNVSLVRLSLISGGFGISPLMVLSGSLRCLCGFGVILAVVVALISLLYASAIILRTLVTGVECAGLCVTPHFYSLFRKHTDYICGRFGRIYLTTVCRSEASSDLYR